MSRFYILAICLVSTVFASNFAVGIETDSNHWLAHSPDSEIPKVFDTERSNLKRALKQTSESKIQVLQDPKPKKTLKNNPRNEEQSFRTQPRFSPKSLPDNSLNNVQPDYQRHLLYYPPGHYRNLERNRPFSPVPRSQLLHPMREQPGTPPKTWNPLEQNQPQRQFTPENPLGLNSNNFKFKYPGQPKELSGQHPQMGQPHSGLNPRPNKPPEYIGPTTLLYYPPEYYRNFGQRHSIPSFPKSIHPELYKNSPKAPSLKKKPSDF